MFQRALRTWDRLVRRQPGAARVEEDRRVWVRYPCQLETTAEPANDVQPEKMVARVRDISRGGAQLVVKRRLEIGTLLSVDLPGTTPSEVSAILAYVVRVALLPDGDWSVGCTFATQLGADDLLLFGAKRQKAPQADQRAWVRFGCEARASFRPVRGAEGEEISAEVFNISPTGIGLVAERAIDLGTLLTVELRGPRDYGTLTMMASVVRVTALTAGRWVFGCNFLRELSDRELRALL